MQIIELQWDDINVGHISQHYVDPNEVEDVCYGLHISAKQSGQRYVLCGQSGNGRYLTVVIERIGKGIFRPITAFEMSENYKSSYKRRLER